MLLSIHMGFPYLYLYVIAMEAHASTIESKEADSIIVVRKDVREPLYYVRLCKVIMNSLFNYHFDNDLKYPYHYHEYVSDRP